MANGSEAETKEILEKMREEGLVEVDSIGRYRLTKDGMDAARFELNSVGRNESMSEDLILYLKSNEDSQLVRVVREILVGSDRTIEDHIAVSIVIEDKPSLGVMDWHLCVGLISLVQGLQLKGVDVKDEIKAQMERDGVVCALHKGQILDIVGQFLNRLDAVSAINL